ncbi:MAG: transcriptional regulator [Gallionellaceae bacterium]|nr:MAG: transcriptional regulator [Gallionellaceae bacterium]
MKLLKLPAVLSLTTGGRSTHHKRIHEGLMVPPVRIGQNSVAYPENEIIAINAARIAGKSDDEIRQLVAGLVANRNAA